MLYYTANKMFQNRTEVEFNFKVIYSAICTMSHCSLHCFMSDLGWFCDILKIVFANHVKVQCNNILSAKLLESIA